MFKWVIIKAQFSQCTCFNVNIYLIPKSSTLKITSHVLVFLFNCVTQFGKKTIEETQSHMTPPKRSVVLC